MLTDRIGYRLLCEAGATTAHPHIVDGGVIVGLADKEHQMDRSDRCAMRSHTATALLTMSDQAQTGSVTPRVLTAGTASKEVLAAAFHPTMLANAAGSTVLCMMDERNKKRLLTFDFERRPLEPSIQTYSAMTWPFWGRLRYFWSCK